MVDLDYSQLYFYDILTKRSLQLLLINLFYMNYENLEGSGPRAMSENEKALVAAQQELQELAQRAEQGEDVDAKLRRVNERIQFLKKDQQVIDRAI